MSEIKCPKCGAIFTVDEADYAAILNQVKNDAYEVQQVFDLSLHQKHHS